MILLTFLPWYLLEEGENMAIKEDMEVKDVLNDLIVRERDILKKIVTLSMAFLTRQNIFTSKTIEPKYPNEK